MDKERSMATEVYMRMLADPQTFRDMLQKHPKTEQKTVKERLSRSLNATLQRMAVQSAVTAATDQRALEERQRRLTELEQQAMQGNQ
jgi:hypothetical protein